MEGAGNGDRIWVNAWIAIGTCFAVAVSEFLPWIVAGVGTGAIRYSGYEVRPLAVAVLMAATAVCALCAAALLLKRADLLQAATVAAAVLLAFTVGVIVALEIAALAIPADALPATLRRNGLELSAGIGLWTASAAACGAVVALSGYRPRSLQFRALGLRVNRNWLLALMVLLTLTVLFGWLRYQVWFSASAAGEHLDLAGWASPWIGPLSLLAVWLLVLALGLALSARTTAAGLTAAIGGWLVTVVAAISIIAAKSIGGLSALAGQAVPGSPGFHVTLVAWTSFAVGLGAAAIGGWLVSLRAPAIPR